MKGKCYFLCLFYEDVLAPNDERGCRYHVRWMRDGTCESLL